MMHPTRRQQEELDATLRQFAFEQSPMFRSNQIQTMKVSQEFTFFDQPALPRELDGRLLRDRTTIELGFRASRFVQPEFPTLYYYEISTVGSHAIRPRDLRRHLTHESWADLYNTYGDPAEVYDTDGTTESDEQARKEMQDEILDAMYDEGTDCEIYQSTLLTYGTDEGVIESSYERGISVNNAAYEVLNSHASNNSDDDDDEIPAPRRWSLPHIQGPDGPISEIEELEIDGFFEQIVGIIDDDGRPSVDFLPHDEKLREVLHVIECLRKHSL